MQNPDHDPIFQKESQIPIPIQKKDRDPDFAIFDRDPTQPCLRPVLVNYYRLLES